MGRRGGGGGDAFAQEVEGQGVEECAAHVEGALECQKTQEWLARAA